MALTLKQYSVPCIHLTKNSVEFNLSPVLCFTVMMSPVLVVAYKVLFLMLSCTSIVDHGINSFQGTSKEVEP